MFDYGNEIPLDTVTKLETYNKTLKKQNESSQYMFTYGTEIPFDENIIE